MSRNESPAARAWIERLERVLRDIPDGVSLYGMDDDLILVDDVRYQDHVDNSGTRTPFLGTFEVENSDAMTTVKTGKAYTDSAGW